MTGQPITASKITRGADGSPFLTNEWKFGSIVQANVKRYRHELSKFIHEEALKGKAEADMAMLVEYYNNLTGQ